jgi:hypothetical protein
MRNFLSVALNIIAGFFFYNACLLSFINDPANTTSKWQIVFGFNTLAIIALCGGLALKNFKNWKGIVGIILLSSSAVMVFLIFTISCMLATEEFKAMFKQENIDFLSDYLSGATFTSCLMLLGFLFMKLGRAQ